MFVVTGGGKGLGRALAHALSKRGHPVLIVGRHQDQLKEAASLSSLIEICSADVSTRPGREKVIKQLEHCNNIEGLIHNAGIIEPICRLSEVVESAWDKTLATNLNAPLFLTQILLPKLTKGRVLHIGSGVAHFPVAAWGAYCVSKAALFMLTRCFQLESKTTAFSSVMPGIIDTDMQALVRESTNMEDEKLNFFKTLQREQRLLTPATVALFLSWLLLDVDRELYISKEWDIYDKSHHKAWLFKPHVVPHWE